MSIKCDLYSYSPCQMSDDDQWDWDELIGLLEDECMKVINSASAEQGRAWKNPKLLYVNNLRDAVLAEQDILDYYNKTVSEHNEDYQTYFDQYCVWLHEITVAIIDSNRPNYVQIPSSK